MTATASPAAAGYPAPRRGEWIARDFIFHTGEVMPELRVAYTTVGAPSGEPVLALHGTTGSADSLLTPAFAGELFGPGQPLDAGRYFIILPDAIGHGRSAKPSDGLRTKFPPYNYADMVAAQHRLIAEHFGISRLRLLIGHSMGGMHAWLWGAQHPDAMDVLVSMAAQPTPMASRNWMLRRMLIELVRNDPAYANGDYIEQPKLLPLMNALFGIATNGGGLAYQAMAPTREDADRLVDERLALPFTADANDYLYQWQASRDYDAAAGLGRIRAAVLAIVAADDERNPLDTGIMARAIARVPNGRLLVIPAGPDTRGHGTTGFAKFYKTELLEVLRVAPQSTAGS